MKPAQRYVRSLFTRAVSASRDRTRWRAKHSFAIVCLQADKALLGIEREIVIMKLIEHPNVMRLYDVWETGSDL